MAIPATIDEQVDMIKDYEISYRTLHRKAYVKDTDTSRIIEIPYLNIINKYKEPLKNIIQSLILDDKLYYEYLYKPKMLSYDLYGTTELWFELLRLNGWSSIIEFKPRKIKVYAPDEFKSYINEILILESNL